MSHTQKVKKCSWDSFEQNMFGKGFGGRAYTRHLIDAF